MKKILPYIMILFLSSCSPTKHVEFRQEECLECPFYISFDKSGKSIKSTLIIKMKIILKNRYLQFSEIKINYFREGEQVATTNALPLYFDKRNNNFNGFVNDKGELHRISLNPLSEREIFFEVWYYMDDIDTEEERYKNLKEYISSSRPFKEYDEIFKIYREDKNILSYEEPFSEFKRKNPELLEFLTKGDSIELEVLSPVKQKYKFKAEW